MLDLVRVLLTDLNRRQVRYCHWKSNASLDQALEGIGDLDLLVDPDHAAVLDTVLAGLGFVEALPADGPGDQASRHYVGLDEPSGRLVHLDVYDRLLTGGTLLKNHHLPLEAMLFASLRCQDSVPVPGRAAELVLLVLRKLIESASPLEHALLLREYDQVRREVSWLAANAATRADAEPLVGALRRAPHHLRRRRLDKDQQVGYGNVRNEASQLLRPWRRLRMHEQAMRLVDHALVRDHHLACAPAPLQELVRTQALGDVPQHVEPEQQGVTITPDDANHEPTPTRPAQHKAHEPRKSQHVDQDGPSDRPAQTAELQAITACDEHLRGHGRLSSFHQALQQSPGQRGLAHTGRARQLHNHCCWTLAHRRRQPRTGASASLR